MYRVGQKIEATLHFAQYLENYHTHLQNFFAHIKTSVYSIHNNTVAASGKS